MFQPQKIVYFGELLMRLAPPGNLRFFQAKSFDINQDSSEVNFAVSLAHFGMTTQFVIIFPDNDLSIVAVQALKKYGVGIH